MGMEFQINDKYAELMKWHVSQDRRDSYRLMCESEWGVVGDHIKSPKRVLDLGCGLGRMSIYVNWMLKDTSIYWILADSTCATSSRPKFGWNPPGERFYSNLEWTKAFAQDNGLSNFEIFDLVEQDLGSLKDVDLVMSFLSVGFHYPIDGYIETLLGITTEDCVMIFGVRQGRDEHKKIAKYFNKSRLLKQGGTINTREDILVLYGGKR